MVADGDTAAETDVTATDGGPLAPGGVSLGMYAVVVAAALLGVALGAAAFEYAQLIESTVTALLS
ncbi:hypothetical protein NGM10_02830 [Halorussus salilacus]|uniref:hypothetical protein n=1 Tax=Halorussus salilacus TaxID=2953750 RepID=UPI00209F04FF|nr:hypothetical protein [Halorussus salilacus]USZ68683.1 hypothetical protein NGM10_02830 [Halorussus salilacus]